MTSPARNVAVNGNKSVEEIAADVDNTEVKKLRDRWELASVLNFLNVFEAVIGGDLKITAGEIEAALIKPNIVLAKLHIALLKGIPPVSKDLKISDPDSWVTCLCKKLAMWWPWVAEGGIPLRAAKGEEVQKYKELDPTIRLLMLKALCEVRAEQHDAVSHINDALKNGTQISSIRKDKIGEDRNGASYWYDGNAIIGHRLYKEVTKSESRTKNKSREYFPAVGLWETIATNLAEFRKVVDELSTSRAGEDVAIAKAIEAGAIPILERLQKNKERALKRKQRHEMLLNNAQNPIATGIKRSCRNRKPVCYTYDDYDRTINEALQQAEVRNTTEEKRPERNHVKQGQRSVGSTQHMDVEKDMKGSIGEKDGSMDSNTKSNKPEVVDNDDEAADEYCSSDDKMENDSGCDDDDDWNNLNSNISISDDTTKAPIDPQNQGGCDAEDNARVHLGKRVAGLATNHMDVTRSPGTKNRLRQRPIQNSALDSAIVPDSDDDS